VRRDSGGSRMLGIDNEQAVMRGIECPRDGRHLDADDDGGLFAALRRHFDANHPGVADSDLRKLIPGTAYDEAHRRAWIYELRVAPGVIEALTEAQQAAVDAHVDYLERLLDEGTLIVGGATDDGLGVIAFFADSETEARVVMERDPTVATGLFAGVLRRYMAGFARGGQPHNMRRSD
jgi:uncharacterized protein YciI